MRVFVTGATGFIGSAVVQELIGAGHRVVGLARSAASASALAAAGAEAHPGSLDDLESLRRGAVESDGVVHLAFIHDFSDYAGACETDRQVIEALGAALAGSGRPLVVTSGTLSVVRKDHVTTERDTLEPGTVMLPRGHSEVATQGLATQGVRASILRLPPSVHGDGDRGFIPILGQIAREKRVSAFIGDGANRWPAVHRLDAARLFRLALETAPAGSILHGVADEGVPFRQIAEVIGRRVGVPTASVAPEQAEAHFGWPSFAASLDNPTSSALTRERFGWTPAQPGLLDDIDRDSYFAS